MWCHMIQQSKMLGLKPFTIHKMSVLVTCLERRDHACWCSELWASGTPWWTEHEGRGTLCAGGEIQHTLVNGTITADTNSFYGEFKQKSSLTRKKLLLLSAAISWISASVDRLKTATRFMSSIDTARHRKLHTHTQRHIHRNPSASVEKNTRNDN